MKRVDIVVLLALAWLAATTVVAHAQTETPTPPLPGIPLVHVIQAGENLTLIAQQYDVTVEAIQLVNNLSDASVIFPGQELIIPGGEGEAIPTVYTVEFGDTLAGVAARFATSRDALVEANRLIHPYLIPAVGQTLSVVSRSGSAAPQTLTGSPHVVAEGESLLEIAARHGLSVLELATLNDLSPTAVLLPGQRLRLPGEAPYRELPGGWLEMRLGPLPVVQGNTVSLYAATLDGALPGGEFAGQPLRFAPEGEGFVALVGVDAFTEPGRYTVTMTGSDAPFQQEIDLLAGDFGTQYIVVDDALSGLLDSELRRTEDAFLTTIYATFSDERRWDGVFQSPVTSTIVTAGYGGARSYNDGPIDIYHSGVDFAGQVGTPILAPAAGTVVFSDTLELRGQTLIIDHGLGVMTGYYHLSEILVAVGDSVTAGQPVAAGGSTGLSTGPHLHWDLRVMDVPVNGMQWLERAFP